MISGFKRLRAKKLAAVYDDLVMVERKEISQCFVPEGEVVAAGLAEETTSESEEHKDTRRQLFLIVTILQKYYHDELPEFLRKRLGI